MRRGIERGPARKTSADFKVSRRRGRANCVRVSCLSGHCKELGGQYQLPAWKAWTPLPGALAWPVCF